MASHPPIPVMDFADHQERLKANDNLKFSQEYEVIAHDVVGVAKRDAIKEKTGYNVNILSLNTYANLTTVKPS